MWKPEVYSASAKAKMEEASEHQAPPQQPQHKNSKPNEIFEVSAGSDYCEAGYLGLCVLAVLDGSPLNTEHASQLALLEKVQYTPANKGRPLKFMWVDGLCHPTFGQPFDASPDK
jgi:hypothetical protein